MNEYDEKWEDLINALLDGELSAEDADRLKAEASDDRDLARAIVEAYQLQQAMEAVHVERAPASLRKRLRAIPRNHRSKPLFGFLQPRWAVALAAIPLVLISVSLMQPDTPSAADVAQARQEMAIAFAYLDMAGVITGREIGSNVGHTMADAVTGSVNKAIKSQNLYSKEKEA
jgi:anti-sigma factor RsiW